MKKKRSSAQFAWLIFDGLMVALVFINIQLILFDWAYDSDLVKDFFLSFLPIVRDVYDPVHRNFLVFDLIFVAIFAGELFLRWGLSIRNKEYDRWYLYPIYHWFDVLGLIPISGFRTLRFLRVLTMIVRLHKMGWVDIRSWWLFHKFEWLVDVVTEEISDRVVIKIIEGIKVEINSGIMVTDSIISDVLRPHQDALSKWIARRITHIIQRHVHIRNEEIRAYVEETVRDSVAESKQIQRFRSLPIIGGEIKVILEESISEISFNVIQKILTDLSSPQNEILVSSVSDAAFDLVTDNESDDNIDEIVKTMTNQALDLVKKQVQIQQWRLNEVQESNAADS